MTVIGTAYIDVESRTDGFERGLSSKVSGIASKVAGVFAAAFVIKEGINFAGGLIKDAEEAQKVASQTAAVIKSTGGAAKVSAGEVDALAGAISRKTGIDDEAIASGENLLLTFTGVRNEAGKGNDIFSRATKTLVDMGAAMKTGPSGSAIQLGKALNDPIKGITALTRVGVTFTEQQKAQIKTMQEAGDVAGAQRVILDELDKEFGGSAESQATASAKLSVAWGNVREELGAKLLPVVNKVATFLADNLPNAMDQLSVVIDRVSAGIGRVVAAVAPTVAAIVAQVQAFWNTLTSGFTEDEGTPIERFALMLRNQVIPAIQEVVSWVGDHLTPILAGLALIFAPGAALVAGIVFAYTRFQVFRDVVATVADFITGTVGPAIASFASYVTDSFRDMVKWTQQYWGQISEAIDHVMRVVRTIVETVAGVIAALWRAWGDDLLAIAKTVWNYIRETIDNGVRVVQGIIKTVLALINGDWGKAWDGIKQILGAVWDQIGNIISTAAGILRGIVGGLVSTLQTVWFGAWDAIKGKVGDAFGAIKDAVVTGIGEVLSFFRDLPYKITQTLGDLAGRFGEIGWSIIRGLVKGIKDAAGDILQGALDWVTDKIPDWKGPASRDVKLLEPTGKMIMRGLVDGIRAGSADVQAYLQAVTANIVSAVGQAVSGLRALQGVSGAQAALRDAVAARRDLTTRAARLPGWIRDAEQALSAAQAAAAKVTPAEQLAIDRAMQDVLDKTKDLDEARADGTHTALELRIMEGELRESQEALTAAQKASTGVTDEVNAAWKELNELRDEATAISDKLADAEVAVRDAQLGVVDAQAQMLSQSASLAANKELIEWFQTVAREAGLSESAIRGMVAALTGAGAAPGAGGTKPPNTRPIVGPKQPKVDAGMIANIGKFVGENWSQGKVDRIAQQIANGDRTIDSVIADVSRRINGPAAAPTFGPGSVVVHAVDDSRLAVRLGVTKAVGTAISTATRLAPKR